MKSLISHIEINVLDYKKSVQFYDLIFKYIGLERINCTKSFTAYTDGMTKVILCPTDEQYREHGFHRKRPGLNHLAFYASTKSSVDEFYQKILVQNEISTLYKSGPFGDENYYAVFFEDPDRLKLEFVFALNYCSKEHWPNTLENDFDPYK